MTLARLARKAIRSWQAWRSQRAIYRELPHIRLIDEAISQARRQHRSTANLQAAKRAFMHNALLGRR